MEACGAVGLAWLGWRGWLGLDGSQMRVIGKNPYVLWKVPSVSIDFPRFSLGTWQRFRSADRSADGFFVAWKARGAEFESMPREARSKVQNPNRRNRA